MNEEGRRNRFDLRTRPGLKNENKTLAKLVKGNGRNGGCSPVDEGSDHCPAQPQQAEKASLHAVSCWLSKG